MDNNNYNNNFTNNNLNNLNNSTNNMYNNTNSNIDTNNNTNINTSVMSGGNMYGGVSSYTNTEPVMTEERRLYLLEKEQKMNQRNKSRKIVGFTILGIVLSVVVIFLYKNYFRPVEIDSRIDKDSIHYVTDLYYSDGRYYNEYLDVKEKKIYIEFLNDLKNVEKETVLDCRDFGYENEYICGGVISKIVEIVLMEHPDLFWYRTSSYSYGTGMGVVIKHHYVTQNKLSLYFVERRLLRKIDELASKFEDMSEEEQVKAVYTWLGETTHYSTIMTRKSGTAWSALLSDDSVCAGFAAASQLLFQRLGIDSILVVGNYDGEGHAWNFVELDGIYYWYDSTVAGSVSKDSYYFYNGLFFSDNSRYEPDILDMNKFKFGSKEKES